MATADYRAPSMTCAEYRESVRRGAVGYFTCEHCGAQAYRRLSGTSKSPNRFCSMGCRVAAAEAKNLALQQKRLHVRQEIEAIRRIGVKWRRYFKRQHIERCLVRACIDCSKAFQQRTHKGRPEQRCASCADKEARRQHRTHKLRRTA